uniref:Uncharacterized protein n=1 Tax=Oscillatoriales cyanobacterium SpSt-402 TaxID=2282168 RepID=A0A832H5J0_9CYAN
MKYRLLTFGVAVISALWSCQLAHPVSAAIAEREPNDERSQLLGNLGLNQSLEVMGGFTTNDVLDHYKIEVMDNQLLRVRLKSNARLTARIFQDRDGSGTVSQADPFIGMIQVGQSLKTQNSGSYIIRVLKPAAMSPALSTYHLSLQAER